MTARGALDYLDLPKRSPAQIVADCLRLAETCRRVAASAAAACNHPAARYYEQRAADLEARADNVACAQVRS